MDGRDATRIILKTPDSAAPYGQMAKDFEHGQQLAHQLSQEIRTMSYLLHPPCWMKPVYQ